MQWKALLKARSSVEDDPYNARNSQGSELHRPRGIGEESTSRCSNEKLGILQADCFNCSSPLVKPSAVYLHSLNEDDEYSLQYAPNSVVKGRRLVNQIGGVERLN